MVSCIHCYNPKYVMSPAFLYNSPELLLLLFEHMQKHILYELQKWPDAKYKHHKLLLGG